MSVEVKEAWVKKVKILRQQDATIDILERQVNETVEKMTFTPTINVNKVEFGAMDEEGMIAIIHYTELAVDEIE